MSETPYWTAQNFAEHSNVPHGTFSDFTRWYGLLRKWNARINLVAPKEVDQFWHRHAYDSWQLTTHLPQNWNRLVDLGSGGGFPGLAFGIFAKQKTAKTPSQNPGQQVHLVESVGKKTSFLKTVTRELGLPVTVHTDRVENLPPLKADVLTARAFAPLPRLFTFAQPHLTESAVLLLPKGESADKEIESAREGWHFDVESFKSETDSAAAILRITDLRAK